MPGGHVSGDNRSVAEGPVADFIAMDRQAVAINRRDQEWHESKVRRQILHRNIGKLGSGRRRITRGRYE